jgi:hypothetical protein
VEAKVAWVASAGSSPNDFTAVKLCPVAGKWIDPKLADKSSNAHRTIPSTQFSASYLRTFVANWAIRPIANRQRSVGIKELSYFSAPMFFRPPPAL